jgi:ornithine cyclodeaminase/alanine dehydrogenase-like protein (mu-crystallin family)
MTSQQMSSESILVLTRQEIADLMNFENYVSAVEDAFKLYEEGKALSPGVLDIEAIEGAFHIKAAGLQLKRTYVATKVNGNFAQNRNRFGLPTIQGAITLCDGGNGSPLAFMDSIEITINRTGAATTVGAKYLARPDSTTATVCGCGEQGKVQLLALAHVLPLQRVYAYDLNENTTRTFVEQMEKRLNITVEPAKSVREATRHSDVIVTCTTSRHHFLSKDDVPPGAFIAAVGADSHDKQELEPALLGSNKLVVDILEQCATIGELHHALRKNVMAKADVYAELGEIVAGRKPGRVSEDEITILDTTGTALQDVAAAATIYERAKAEGVGYLCKLSE